MFLSKVSKAFLAACILSASFLFASGAQAQKLPLEGYQLDVGLSPAPPFVIIEGEFQNVSGIDVDIIRELQRRTGFEIKRNRFHIMGFGDLLDLAEKGYMDISAAAISISDARAKIFTQSPTTYRSEQVLVVPSNSNIDSPQDLIGKTLAAEDGTEATDLVAPELAKQINILHERTLFMSFYSVIRGKSDALITEAPMAVGFMNSWGKGKLKVAYHVAHSENDFGIMFKKDTPASKVLYKTFKEMQADGTIQKIIHKYLPDYKMPEDLKPQNIKLAAD